MSCIKQVDLELLKKFSIPGINHTASWCMIILIYGWIQIANILLRIFVSVFIKNIKQWFSFFVIPFSGFGIRVTVTLKAESGSLSPFAIFWKNLKRIGVSASLNAWQNLSVNPSGPGLLFAGRFLITVSVSLYLWSVYSYFLFFLVHSWEVVPF